MEKIKEFTHKNSKTYKNCSGCIKGFTCPKCRGICIFSKMFLSKYRENQSVRKMLKEKYYKKEFELLRSLKADRSPTGESKANSKSFDNKNDSDSDCESDFEDNLQGEAYKLLEQFHSLSENEKKVILKAHDSKNLFSSSACNAHCRTTKTTQILHLYHHSYTNYKENQGSRQFKKSDSLYYGDGNFVLSKK